MRKKDEKNKILLMKKPLQKSGYGILAGVALVFFSGSIIGLTLLDPFSNFGRMMTHIIRPIAIGMNNALVFFTGKI